MNEFIHTGDVERLMLGKGKRGSKENKERLNRLKIVPQKLNTNSVHQVAPNKTTESLIYPRNHVHHYFQEREVAYLMMIA